MGMDHIQVEELPIESYVVPVEGGALSTKAKRLVQSGGIDLTTYGIVEEQLKLELDKLFRTTLKDQLPEGWSRGSTPPLEYKRQLLAGLGHGNFKSLSADEQRVLRESNYGFDLLTQMTGLYKITNRDSIGQEVKVVVPPRRPIEKKITGKSVDVSPNGIVVPNSRPSQNGEGKVILEPDPIVILDPITADLLGLEDWKKAIARVDALQIDNSQKRELVDRITRTRELIGVTYSDLAEHYQPSRKNLPL